MAQTEPILVKVSVRGPSGNTLAELETESTSLVSTLVELLTEQTLPMPGVEYKLLLGEQELQAGVKLNEVLEPGVYQVELTAVSVDTLFRSFEAVDPAVVGSAMLQLAQGGSAVYVTSQSVGVGAAILFDAIGKFERTEGGGLVVTLTESQQGANYRGNKSMSEPVKCDTRLSFEIQWSTAPKALKLVGFGGAPLPFCIIGMTFLSVDENRGGFKQRLGS